FDYPAGSNTQTACATPTATPNRANCYPGAGAPNDLTPKGSYPGSASPYGTFDQGGNVWEWNDVIISGSYRGVRGGPSGFRPNSLAASYGVVTTDPAYESGFMGFRVASIPEPSTGLLVIAGLLGLAGWRRARD